MWILIVNKKWCDIFCNDVINDIINKGVENYTTFKVFDVILRNLLLIYGLHSVFITLYSVICG